MRAAYQEGLQKRMTSSRQSQGQIQTTGRHKGFSNDGVSGLMNFGDEGPLDNANNANSRANTLNLKM